MELAVHIRNPGQLDELDRIPDQLLDLYEGLEPEARDWVHSIPEQVERVYIGDEFCVHRTPEPDALVRQHHQGCSWRIHLLH